MIPKGEKGGKESGGGREEGRGELHLGDEGDLLDGVAEGGRLAGGEEDAQGDVLAVRVQQQWEQHAGLARAALRGGVLDAGPREELGRHATDQVERCDLRGCGTNG